MASWRAPRAQSSGVRYRALGCPPPRNKLERETVRVGKIKTSTTTRESARSQGHCADTGLWRKSRDPISPLIGDRDMFVSADHYQSSIRRPHTTSPRLQTAAIERSLLQFSFNSACCATGSWSACLGPCDRTGEQGYVAQLSTPKRLLGLDASTS